MFALGRADVTLAPLFVDHAVLQRDVDLPVWGRAEPGEHVTVSFKDQAVGATAGADGRWIVYLAPVPASDEPAQLVATGRNVVTVSDIVVGEVWLASGQSNMEWGVNHTQDATKEIAAAHYPMLREIKIDRVPSSEPAETVTTTGWRPATPQYVEKFTAIGYFFARDLHRKLGVPIGIINSTWGGTPIESWLSAPVLRGAPAFPAIEARWQHELADFPERKANYPKERAAYDQAAAHARATKTKNPVTPPRVPIGPGTPYALDELFNGMIAPLQPYALRGILWYQGESNWPHPEEYAGLFSALIRSWRAGWGEGDLPFYFVQLANFIVTDDPSQRAWARLREAQASVLTLPATAMTTAIDIGDPKDIHPRNKQEVGRRLALIAKAQVYGIPGDYAGPMFERAQREGAAMRVYFSHAATGLIAHDRPVQALELAGPDHVFHAATAKIDRNTLVVSSPAVQEPVAVRYAWSNAPVANLYSGAGLPAFPFRSDAW